MEFVRRVEISINFSKQKHILYRYNSHDKIVLRRDRLPYKLCRGVPWDRLCQHITISFSDNNLAEAKIANG